MKKRGKFKVNDKHGSVSYLLEAPAKPLAQIVLAHGAGTDMRHQSLEDLTQVLVDSNMAVFRYNFPYKEQGKGGPNPAPTLQETIRMAILQAQKVSPKLPLFAGGKSMGGRMTSLLLAEDNISGISGLIYFGFPLHAVGRPSTERGDHLKAVKPPQLFLSGTRDTMGDIKLLKNVTAKLKKDQLVFLEGADHSYKVLKSGPLAYEKILARVGTECLKFVKKYR